MRRHLALAALFSVVLSIVSPSAGAIGEDANDSYTSAEQADQGDVVLTVGTDGSVSQPAPKGGRLDCLLHRHAPSFETPTDNPPLGGDELVEDAYYWLVCTDASGEQVVARIFQYVPGQSAITPEELARRAREQLAIRYPEPRTSPAISIDQIVGIETWMWIDAAVWQPVTSTAAIPGLSISATATPQRVTWQMGDGATVVCEGPGTPYDDSREFSEQSSDCTHTYQRRGAHTASATVEWSVEWRASDGSGGPLASASRTTQFPMTVIERQAIGR